MEWDDVLAFGRLGPGSVNKYISPVMDGKLLLRSSRDNQGVRNKGYEKLCLKYCVHVQPAAVRTTCATLHVPRNQLVRMVRVLPM